MTSIENIKLPPNNYELEKRAISICFLFNDKIEEYGVSTNLFYNSNCKKIFNSITNLIKKKLELDPKLIWEDSGLNCELVEDIIYYIGWWNDEAIFNELKELAISRFIQKVLQRSEWMIHTSNWYEVKDYILKELDKIKPITKDMTMEDYAMEFLDNIWKQRKIYKTIIKDIDDNMILCPWQLVIIAGRPWMWKTTVIQNLALRQAINHKVAMISLEMSWIELVERFVCMTTSKTMQEIKKEENINLVSSKLWELLERNLYIKDKISKLSDIESYIRKLKINWWLDIVYIDYLWLIRWTKKTTIDNISEITGELKLMAQRYDICIILGSQLNREVEKRVNKEPQMSDLRDSGSIEQDADIVIMLYREDYYDRQTDNQWKLWFLIRKQRNWKTRDINLNIKLEHFQIF